MPSDVTQTVRAKVESAEIVRDPFPHLAIPDLLPQDFFERLRATIPPLDTFEQSRRGIKQDLPLGETNSYFAAAPDDFKAVWREWRDEVLAEGIAPVLVERLRDDLREKYADTFSEELADRIMADGLVSSDGRIMARQPGYDLKAHLDSAHFGVTCLLYFTAGEDASSGALCLFRPERTPDQLGVSTYYPETAEGIAIEVVREIPTTANLFVAFLNRRDALHGARVERTDGPPTTRINYQAHVLPRTDLRVEAESFASGLDDPLARERWERYAEARRQRQAEKAASTD